jgi:Ca-activated chloride channel family protein
MRVTKLKLRLFILIAVLLLQSLPVLPDAGVLLPRDKQQPDPSILSLEEMEITVTIDNSDARVFVRQIFANHTSNIEEGNYIIALGSRAMVSDFATWDGPVRLPAVILERKRAEEIYESLKQQAIDPGLLQMGERDTDETRRTSIFSAKITPIPAYGTKRLEFEYHESIPVENFKSFFAVPLKPSAYHVQKAAHLSIHFELNSAHPVQAFNVLSKIYPLKIEQKTAHTIRAGFQGENVDLTEDFAVQYELQQLPDQLHVLTHRDPDPGQQNPTETAPRHTASEPGFFEVQTLLASKTASQRKNRPGHNVVVLFDNSLSMQWDKLERSYAALQKVLHELQPQDRFNLLLFNSKVTPFQPQMTGVTPVALRQADEFIQNSKLRGGTNLQQALEAALNHCRQNAQNNYVVVLTDGEATRGPIHSGKLAAWYEQHWKALDPANRPRLFVFAVGDDANLPLLKMLTRNDGVLESALSTEPVEFKLDSFVSKMELTPAHDLRLAVAPDSAVNLVYPLQDAAFGGSMASWVGKYEAPRQGVAFHVLGSRDGEAFDIPGTATLPPKSLDHPQLARLWAKARVDALLEKIERDGEDAASIDEIIKLARKYKFVTPYTSFLAVPRALLRPRVIRPGDPVLRVHTDPAIISVVALFPFGLTKPLRYLGDEKVWQTRFLAPSDMTDGTYSVRLVLRDRQGNIYRESKSFVIASKPPTLKITLEARRFRRGDSIRMKVSASSSTRTLVANLTGAIPVNLHWNAAARASTGELQVPTDLSPGTYRLIVTAEDIAHNIGSQEVQIEVLP